ASTATGGTRRGRGGSPLAPGSSTKITLPSPPGPEHQPVAVGRPTTTAVANRPQLRDADDRAAPPALRSSTYASHSLEWSQTMTATQTDPATRTTRPVRPIAITILAAAVVNTGIFLAFSAAGASYENTRLPQPVGLPAVLFLTVVP